MEEETISYDIVREKFTEYLRVHKHRKTPERYNILEEIYRFEGHFNAETLFRMMEKKYRVSLATIYNTLELLVESHLIIKHLIDGKYAQYEKVFGNNTHHHLICTRCGKVKEFSDKQLKMSIQAKQFSNFEITHYSLYLYGICGKCQEEIFQKEEEKINN